VREQILFESTLPLGRRTIVTDETIDVESTVLPVEAESLANSLESSEEPDRSWAGVTGGDLVAILHDRWLGRYASPHFHANEPRNDARCNNHYPKQYRLHLHMRRPLSLVEPAPKHHPASGAPASPRGSPHRTLVVNALLYPGLSGRSPRQFLPPSRPKAHPCAPRSLLRGSPGPAWLYELSGTFRPLLL